MTSAWRTRPVFISSTFRDMHAERDWLRHHVFPRLEEKLGERRHKFEPIDLRVGVETTDAGTEEARELLVLKVCLDEIKRSRPFLIVLLGDRYGWVPPQDRMAAAAQEAGFARQVRRHSVTALEIEYGILRESPEQRQRCFFYFRDPLPYDAMPAELAEQYSDAHATDSDAPARADALKVLKRRLEDDPELGPRIRHYQAGWDPSAGRVNDLEAWGEQVFQDIWGDLEAETRAFAQQPPPTWEEAERSVLAEFVEHRSAGFVGREKLVAELLEVAHSPTQEGVPGGACVTGEAGSGKSALFAHLHQRLTDDRSVFVLAHAAGIGLRASQVDAMLRRWIGELAAFLDTSFSLPENTGNEEVEQAFASLLGRAAQRRRVVVLVDALNEFEPTARGRYVTWVPKLWPANARLIAMGQAGTATEALVGRQGGRGITLGALTEGEAEEISRGIWGRYHRGLNRRVRDMLLGKRRADGRQAWGNPLWLQLANEQLNLLDADDFERAERQFSGTPAERLEQMLADMTERVPADVEGLYEWLLAQNEKVFGMPYARGFAVAVALSRFGWRESDLLALIPRLAAVLSPGSRIPLLDDLKLASLRRGFRAHLVRRGEQGCLDFFHAQARTAINRRLQSDAFDTSMLHSTIADHLQSISPDDSLRQSELMFHLIHAAAPTRAAQYYSGGLSTGELAGATGSLADHILGDPDQHTSLSAVEVFSWLKDQRLARTAKLTLCHQFIHQLQTTLVQRGASSSVRLALVQAVQHTMPQLRALGRIGMGSELWASYGSASEILLERGKIREAIKICRKALKMAQNMVKLNPNSVTAQYEVAVSWERLGEAYEAQGNLRRALKAQHNAFLVFEHLVSQRQAHDDFLQGLGSCRSRMGSLRLKLGCAADGLDEFRECLRIAEQLVENRPSNLAWQRELIVSRGQVGNALLASGDATNAIKAYHAALDVATSLVHQDPTNADYVMQLALCHANIGDALKTVDDTTRALSSFQEAVQLLELLAKRSKSDTKVQGNLARLYVRMISCHTQADQHDCARDMSAQLKALIISMRKAGIHLDEGLLKWLRQNVASREGLSWKTRSKAWWKLWS